MIKMGMRNYYRIKISYGKLRNIKAANAMKADPTINAIQPESAAWSGRPRPMAWPTRTAPAADTPRGTMKVKEAVASAT